MPKKTKTIKKTQENIPDILHKLREHQPSTHKVKWGNNFGQRVSDVIAKVVGSWKFIIIQAAFLILWIVINAIGAMEKWDPYPFILLNLILSFQAAFTAPIIMMSQNRQNEIDRQKAAIDYKINRKAELEIEQLHQKIDLLREQEIKKLINIIERLEKRN